jgi:hypothetical protein
MVEANVRRLVPAASLFYSPQFESFRSGGAGRAGSAGFTGAWVWERCGTRLGWRILAHAAHWPRPSWRLGRLRAEAGRDKGDVAGMGQVRGERQPDPALELLNAAAELDER